jgi:predicted oxidoreductase (fatty acid repression mutant protein)
MSTNENFFKIEEARRSVYALSNKVSQSNEELEALIKHAVKYAPTAFNNQTVRAVILLDGAHEKFWDIVAKRLKSEVPSDEAYQATLKKLFGFKAGKGTVLFYTDTAIVETFEENVPLYAANFYDWSEQGHGIAEFATWLALVDNGLGANLQHYNPIVDQEVADEFGTPANWRLRAQLVFGAPEADAGAKDFVADDDRFRFFYK